MKEKPILFSAPMVRAILDGLKTQTRRIVKTTRDRNGSGCELAPCEVAGEVNRGSRFDLCPYGQPGDRLWVRETFQPIFAEGFDHGSSPYPNYKTGFGYAISYPATDGIIEWIDGDDNITDRCRPSIHMPRWASRIQLEIVSVRVERLNDISEDDAEEEGAPLELGQLEKLILGSHAKYRSGFVRLWESINGEGSWSDNPWVWVVEFKRIS
jgi:hypothetical protein